MSRLAGSRALVTGASGGVGRALAVCLAKQGVDSVLLARREAELEETAEMVRVAGAKAVGVVGDLTRPEDRAAALRAAQAQLGGLDLLVNNAGVGAHGRFDEATPEGLRKLFEVNFFGLVELTREALPLLSEGGGCVANVGSVLGWRGAPFVSDYCASKFALRGWSEAIRPELRPHGVHVLHASPSTIASDFRSHLLDKTTSVPWGKRAGVSPERVADRVVRGIERRRNEVAIVWEDWAFVRAARLVPRLMDRVMNRYA